MNECPSNCFCSAISIVNVWDEPKNDCNIPQGKSPIILLMSAHKLKPYFLSQQLLKWNNKKEGVLPFG